MKRLEDLWREVANELATWCCTSAARDIKTVSSRIEHEGESFLTIVLPAFGKDFERSLERGLVDSSVFVGFSRQKQGPLPLLLGGFLNQVFDSGDGQLLDDPSIDCIFAVRQLTQMFGKILIPCTPARTRVAIEGYIKCEEEVKESAESITEEERSSFSRVAALLWSSAFSELERRLVADQTGDRYLLPRHGPGATADKLRGNAKFNQLEWPLRLQGIFPFEEFAMGSLPVRHDDERMNRVAFLNPESERPVKVVTVPKTPKIDRIIAEEPTSMQYMQQALLREFVDVLEADAPPISFWSVGNVSESDAKREALFRERTRFQKNRGAAKHLPSDFLGFTNQEPNRCLAKLGSLFGHLATLDLSEASDRVSVQHVEDLLFRWPLLLEAVMAVRSSKAAVPGKYKNDPDRIIDLRKYASMGSALCFPVEALVFVTSVFVGVEQALNRPLTHQDINALVGKVRVFGDDIIVPVEYVQCVVSTLESFGFRVNRSKSFWNGKFRESCGGDYYDGMDVTPVRVRRKFPVTRKDAKEVISVVSLRNQLYFLGFWRTCAWLDNHIRRVAKLYPIVEPSSPVIGRHSAFLKPEASGWCVESHSPLVRGLSERQSYPREEPLDGDGALLKFFLRDGENHPEPKHLLRSGRPHKSALVVRWMRPW